MTTCTSPIPKYVIAVKVVDVDVEEGDRVEVYKVEAENSTTAAANIAIHMKIVYTVENTTGAQIPITRTKLLLETGWEELP